VCVSLTVDPEGLEIFSDDKTKPPHFPNPPRVLGSTPSPLVGETFQFPARMRRAPPPPPVVNPKLGVSCNTMLVSERGGIALREFREFASVGFVLQTEGRRPKRR